MDLAGPIKTEALSEAKYFLLCKDEWSTYTYVYFLRDKEKVNLALAKFFAEFEIDSSHTIKRMRSDNGSEFYNNTELLCAMEHIVQESSAVYTPQQNGHAERDIQAIVNMARTFLLSTGLGSELWQEAVNAACYIKNRLPNSNVSKTPYELIFGRKPTIATLRVRTRGSRDQEWSTPSEV